jgi:putative addiction module antidote
MTTELELVQVGDETGVILPKAILERLHLAAGDRVRVHEDADGVRLQTQEEANDGGYEHQMRVARDVMRRRHSLLKKLAE